MGKVLMGRQESCLNADVRTLNSTTRRNDEDESMTNPSHGAEGRCCFITKACGFFFSTTMPQRLL